MSESQTRKIIIGDVHGCLLELEALLDKVNYNQKTDELYFVGDLINKGPDSIGVLELCTSLQAKSVLGNHELHLLNFTQHKIRARTWVSSLAKKIQERCPQGYAFIQNMPLYIEEEDFILVHAGIVPNLALDKTPPLWLTSIRTWDGKGDDLDSSSNPAWFTFYKGEKLVVFGHWAALNGINTDQYIGLDTGCVYGNKLSALILPQRKIVTIQAKQTYEAIKR